MKTVFTGQEVMHRWAAQQQSEGRNSSRSVSFEGAKLYSYSAQIGLMLTSPEGARWAVLEGGRYSNTTSKHQSWARRAAQHHQIARLDERKNWNHGFTTPQDVKSRLEWDLEKLGESYRRAKHATTRTGWIERTEAKLGHANRFCAAFNLPEIPRPAWLPTEEEIARLRSRALEIEVARDQWHAEKRRRAEQAYQLRREAEAARYAENRAKWIAGENVYMPTHSGDILLRLRTDERAREIVETSWGARVSLRSAALLFRLCADRKARSLPYEPRNTLFHVGPYALSEIDAEGNAKVGCHSLKFEEMQRLAGLIGEERLNAAIAEREAVEVVQ